jgi:hypothetical protein
MWRLILASLALAAAAPAWACEDDFRSLATASLALGERPGARWPSPLEFPEGMERYRSATHTQEIAVLVGLDGVPRDRITPVPISRLEAKWHVSGGMVGVKGYASHKFRLLPRPAETWVGDIQVEWQDGFGRTHHQNNRGVVRSYADGTRFDDILTNDRGEVFEHRSRVKVKGRWKSSVLYSDESARPAGYKGLTQSCSSCHDQAGTGGYATGLVPGGDTVLSDELDWSVTKGYLR